MIKVEEKNTVKGKISSPHTEHNNLYYDYECQPLFIYAYNLLKGKSRQDKDFRLPLVVR